MPMNRRTFLQTSAGVVATSTSAIALGTAQSAQAASSSPSKLPERGRIVYSNDLGNTFNTLAPWTYDSAHKMLPMNELMDHSVADVEGIADVHMLEPGQCLVPWWRGRDESGQTISAGDQVRANQQWLAGRGDGQGNYHVIPSRLDYCSQYLLAGGDIVSDFLASCAQRGQQGFISFRLSDTQNSGNAFQRYDVAPYSDSNPPPALGTYTGMEGLSKFYVDHLGIASGTEDWRVGALEGGRPSDMAVGGPLDLLLQSDWRTRGLDWAYPEVRNQVLGMIQDLIANYPLQGLQLDFVRWPRLFRQLDPVLSTQRRAQLITEFVQAVRTALDAKSPNGRLPLYVRVPSYSEYWDQLGIDLKRWSDEELIDLVAVSTGYYTVEDTDLPKARALVSKNIEVNAEVCHVIARGAADSTGHIPYRLTSKEQLRTLAETGYTNGATGLSVFNFAYYRPGPSATTLSEPPFSTLADAKDPAALLDRADKHYTPAFANMYQTVPRMVPRTFTPAPADQQGYDFQISINRPAGGWTQDYRFRILISQLVAGATLDGTSWACVMQTVSGKRVELTATSPMPEPYTPLVEPDGYLRSDDLLPSEDQMRGWLIPKDLLAAGVNTFSVRLLSVPSGTTSVVIGYVDLAPAPE